jgi:hypothetical protein
VPITPLPRITIFMPAFIRPHAVAAIVRAKGAQRVAAAVPACRLHRRSAPLMEAA